MTPTMLTRKIKQHWFIFIFLLKNSNPQASVQEVQTTGKPSARKREHPALLKHEIFTLLSILVGLFLHCCGTDRGEKITINVPLFKKLRDIIFLGRDNNFLSRFEGHFEGAKTFLTP
jgi:hypothetical protein